MIIYNGKNFHPKKGVTQDTLYIHGPEKWIEEVNKINIPVLLIKHQLPFLPLIKESEVIALYLTANDSLEECLPLFYESLNDFRSDIYIYFDNFRYESYIKPFAEKKHITILDKPDKLVKNISSFFKYLNNE